jgi:hypothetical protein
MRSRDCPVGTDWTTVWRPKNCLATEELLLLHSVKTDSEASFLSLGYKNLLPLE